jgi:hypothetical protein
MLCMSNDIPDDEWARRALRRFLVLMLVRVAAQKLADADELREWAVKAGKQ